MRRALVGRHAKLISVKTVGRACPVGLGSFASRPEANSLPAGEREDFLFSFELIERNRKQMAVCKVPQTSRQRAVRVARAENERMGLGRQQRFEETQAHDMVDMSVAKKYIG